MALPPEQINIKRRREEEPVETLFIQSALHQTKRRFTDFVFHRVTLKASESASGDASPSPPTTPAVQRLLRSPRSVSSLHVNRRAPASSMGVPMVRATSPGAEFREAQRIANARKEAEEKHRRAVYGGPSPFTDLQPSSDVSHQPVVRDSSPASVETSSSRAQALRRFQISRSNLDSLRSSPGGIQKRRTGGPAPGVAVLVEQLQRNAHSRKASMVSDLVAEARSLSLKPKEFVQDIDARPPSPVKPRKRPIVNQAEKRWREERKGAISAAKQHLSDTLEKSAQTQQRSWDQESERLAHDLEQVALELEREANHDHGMDIDVPGKPAPPPPASLQHAFSAAPKPPLKHQPRQPKGPRVAPTLPQPEEQIEQAVEEDDEGDYVYDVYVRRPLSEAEMLKNPLAEYESDQQQKDIAKAQPGVGVIVITAEDEEYWDDFVEDDEEEWDSEDADSNDFCSHSSTTAENHPGNDYPDEEASSDEDEDFDFDDSASEDGGTGYMSRYRGHVDSDEDY
ncbi:unnamed protein product [Penicillium camemberti]|uniref:Str. FM013 n=1 Tax=Penicillium camemberti (strain FM 013) TaxID=1429867 RepID=A0A0G4PY16_PENC3|nr:unnamed protein product [Penicillium camemberti]